MAEIRVDQLGVETLITPLPAEIKVDQLGVEVLSQIVPVLIGSSQAVIIG